MRIMLIFGFLACLSGTALAGVYKWTDENGKVHYGDKNDDAKNGVELKIRVPEPPAQQVASAVATTNEKTSDNSSSTKPTDNLQKCLEMARAQANKNSRNPAEIRADSKKLLDLCPGTSYTCETYTERPSANRCTAGPLQPGGSIIRNTTYRR